MGSNGASANEKLDRISVQNAKETSLKKSFDSSFLFVSINRISASILFEHRSDIRINNYKE